MKTQIIQVTDGDVSYDALAFICPGCEAMKDFGTGLHMLPVNSTVKNPQWTWDGNLERPTVSPSILTRYSRDEGKTHDVCHSFLRDGVFEFLNDCTHPLAGQKVEIPDLPEWFTKE